MSTPAAEAGRAAHPPLDKAALRAPRSSPQGRGAAAMSTVDQTPPTVPAVDPAVKKRLEQIAILLVKLEEERAQLILRARAEGASLREIANSTDMSHVGIKKLIGRHLHPRGIEALDEELPDE